MGAFTEMTTLSKYLEITHCSMDVHCEGDRFCATIAGAVFRSDDDHPYGKIIGIGSTADEAVHDFCRKIRGGHMRVGSRKNGVEWNCPYRLEV